MKKPITRSQIRRIINEFKRSIQAAKHDKKTAEQNLEKLENADIHSEEHDNLVDDLGGDEDDFNRSISFEDGYAGALETVINTLSSL